MNKNNVSIPHLSPGTCLIDTHCHLDMEAYGGKVAAVVRAAVKCGVRGITTVGIDLASSQLAADLARRFPEVWSAVGIHPHNAAEVSDAVLHQLAALVENPANRIVGYGEIGLDFAKKYAPEEVQTKAFATQLGLAKELGLPVIIHDRDAHEETLRLLKKFSPYPARGVMHCFSGDLRLARRVIDLGFLISIPGIVTFNRSEQLQEVAREIPLEWLLLETDGPFLAPVPFRGKTNRPEYMVYTAQKVADLRGITLDEVARQTTRNAINLFRLKLPS